MGRSTDRTRRRTRRTKSTAGRSSKWFDHKLQLLTPTPKDRHEWPKHRQDTWTTWAGMSKEDRAEGSKLAPVAALVLDWKGHFGPVFDNRGRRTGLTIEKIEEYEELAGAGFAECKEHLLSLL